MKVKETIAFIGKADEICLDLIWKLAPRHYPLVLVNDQDNQFSSLAEQILHKVPDADIETLDCAKEGCWEADVIAVADAEDLDPRFLEKIKEVATQKILMHTSTGGSFLFPAQGVRTLTQLLPHTGVVRVIRDAVSGELNIRGADDPAGVIARIFMHAGYKTNLLKTALN